MDRGTRFEDRAAWLVARRAGIGASEAAAVLGVSPWESPLSVWLRKTGRAAEVAETEAMRWGSAMEGVLAAEYERRHGVKLHQQVFLGHRDHPWMFATLDGICPDGTLVELKTANWRAADGWGEEDSDDVPRHYLCQVQHQLAVAEAEVCHLFAMIGGEAPRRFVVRRNDDLIASLVEIEKRFWQFVVTDMPPTVLQPSDGRLMHLLHPEASGAITLDEDEAGVVRDWLAANVSTKASVEVQEALRTQVLGLLGPFAAAVLPDGRMVTRKVVAVGPSTVERKAYTFTDLRVKKGRS